MRQVAGRMAALIGLSLVLAGFTSAALGDEKSGDDHGRGFGPHPTLAVPAILVFGGLAVSAAVIAARGRKSKRDRSGDTDAGKS